MAPEERATVIGAAWVRRSETIKRAECLKSKIKESGRTFTQLGDLIGEGELAADSDLFRIGERNTSVDRYADYETLLQLVSDYQKARQEADEADAEWERLK